MPHYVVIMGLLGLGATAGPVQPINAELAVEELERGRRRRDHCRSCHQSLPVYMSNVALRHLAGSTGGAVRRGAEDEEDEMELLLKKLRKRSGEQLRQLGVCVGKPLPNKGACKHFKHSYRWLRFPCCGRCYPCATCHALSECPAAALGAWATRMVCGKCSREMAYSDKPCEHCGNTFTRQAPLTSLTHMSMCLRRSFAQMAHTPCFLRRHRHLFFSPGREARTGRAAPDAATRRG